MKELSRNQQIIMAIGATLMVIGVGCFVFYFMPKVFSVVFMVGAVCFATMQMIQVSSGDGKNIAIRRLKGIMIAADICFILAGLLMLENSYKVLYQYLSWETWLKYCWNNWVVVLLIAAILELYTSHRISNELKKKQLMRKLSTLLYYIVIIVCFTACSQYNVIGSSDLSDIDGRTLYMKTIGIDSLTTVDSCSIIHGKFKFSGSLDSTRIVTLCIDNLPILPIVLEEGEVRVTLNGQMQESKGTPLNDSLTAFNKRYEALLSQYEDLEHTQNQGYMNGENMDSINVILAAKQRQLLMKEDELVTSFISANFDNCLGPYVFQLATSNYRYPVLVPWIEALMTKASQKFKDAPYVKEYMGVAKQNQDIMTGVK